MASATKPTPTASVAGATTALVLLTALNFVNYIDRYILPGVQEQVKHEFLITDKQIGSLTFWFMIAYMFTSPITGWLGDRFPRKPMIVIAALFWSGINFLTATVHSYDSLNLRHAALGVGEASFGIFAPSLLADFYGPDQRNRVLTIFNVAIPVGAALGYLVGGTVGEHFGWRTSFIVSAVPGTIIAILIAFFMKEPARGASQHEKAKLEKGTVLSLLHNKAYLCSILGYAAVTFSLGGISWWMPSFLQRVDGRSESSAAYIMGAITVVTGLGGTITGGAIAQRWSRTNHRALYLVPSISAALAVPPALLCFFGPHSLTLYGLGRRNLPDLPRHRTRQRRHPQRRSPRDPRHRHGRPTLHYSRSRRRHLPANHRRCQRPHHPEHRSRLHSHHHAHRRSHLLHRCALRATTARRRPRPGSMKFFDCRCTCAGKRMIRSFDSPDSRY